MAGPLENIVRPAVDVATTPTRQGVTSLPAAVPDVYFHVGLQGSGKIINGSFNSSVTYYVEQHPKEQ